jgi:hypothetical protein
MTSPTTADAVTADSGWSAPPVDEIFAVASKLPLAGGISTAILAAVVWAIFTGRLTPRSTVEDVRSDRDARLTEIRREADDWRSAWQASQETNRILADQVRELLELGRTTNQLIKALPGPVVLPREPAP